MKLGATVGMRDDPDAFAAHAKRLEDRGVEYLWTGEAYTADAVSTMGFLAAVTKKAQIGSSILPPSSPTPTPPDPPGHDGGRSRQTVAGAVRPGVGRIRAAGRRGLPRGSLRRAARPHPRDHRNLPIRVAARPAPAPGRPPPGAPAPGGGHGA